MSLATVRASVRVALVTWAGAPDVDADDRPLVAALETRGIRASPAVWSHPGVDWTAYDLVVLRSAWDYHRRAGEFLRWVDRPDVSPRLWNRPSTVRWNSNKTYLRDLEARGVPVVPTVWGSEVQTVGEVLRAHGWDRVVIKPSVSADAQDTYLLDAANAAEHEQLLGELKARGEVLIQPFLAEVTRAGERSLVFLAGEYSHAALRESRLAPAPGLRVGTAVEPRPAELAVARHAVKTLLEPSLYARVDVVTDREGVPRVMELELIEPTLFLRTSPEGVERFASAIARLPAAASP